MVEVLINAELIVSELILAGTEIPEVGKKGDCCVPNATRMFICCCCN